MFKATHTTTSVSRFELLLNDTANFKPSQDFVVTNDGKEKQTYRLTHVPAGTALTIDNLLPVRGPEVPLTADAAIVNIRPDKFTLEPGR